jgi:hypothetical protein
MLIDAILFTLIALAVWRLRTLEKQAHNHGQAIIFLSRAIQLMAVALRDSKDTINSEDLVQ